MRQRILKGSMVRHLLITLIAVLCLITISPSPLFALAIEDYFTLNYDIELDKTNISGSETFYATVDGTATCHQNLPLAILGEVTEGYVTSRIVAEHQETGNVVTLRSSYTINIDPFPNTAGESTHASKTVSLSFPTGSQAGTYNVEAIVITAQVNTTKLGWLPVTTYLPSPQYIDTVTYTPGGGGGGGGGIPITADSKLSDYIDDNGTFTEDLIFESDDGICQVTIGEGITGLTEDGEPLNELTIEEMGNPPTPPQDSAVIGLTYELGPEGASFDPAITLTFTYDPTLIPEGVSAENLLLATWDENANEWVVLEGSTVDVANHTISASVTHFSLFTTLAYTHPAAFEVTDLTITPNEADIGETISIVAIITNNGDLAGTYEITLKINDVEVETKQVEVAGGAQQSVAFTLTKDAPGTYTVTVNDLSGTFEVKQPPAPAAFNTSELTISPTEVAAGENVTISINVANSGELAGTYKVTLKINDVEAETKQVEVAGGDSELVSFSISRDTPGVYQVNVDDLSGTFEVQTVTEPESKSINWRLIAIIGGVTAAVAGPLTMRRRKLA